MKELPVGISSFSKIRQDDYAYVDKTDLIKTMLRGQYYFLSRPRRFGKSLLVDTIKEMFSGNKELFKGLAAYEAWGFPVHPVINFNFAQDIVSNRVEMRELIDSIIDANAQSLGVDVPQIASSALRLGALISETRKKYDRNVIILVDEYDKPLLDTLNGGESPALKQIVDRNYADKYRKPSTTIHLIGIEFDPETKNLAAFTHHQD